VAAGSEALVLKVTADTGQVAAGLAPMTKALDKLGDEADAAAKDLRDLSNTDVTISVKDQAMQRARDRIDQLRHDIARDVVLGVDTKAAQREISNLQTAMRRLEDNPPRIEPEVDTSKLDMADELEGIDSLREGALQLGDAVGNLDGSFASFGGVIRESVPALADLNQTMVAMRLRAEAAGGSLGRLGTAASAVTRVVAGPWGLAIAAGAGLLSAWAANSADAADATADLAKEIDLQRGAFDKANRQNAAQILQQKGALDNAEKLGLSTKELTTALLSQTDAYTALGITAEEYEAITKRNPFDRSILQLTDTQKATIDLVHAYQAAQKEIGTTTGDTRQLEAAMALTAESTEDSAEATKSFGDKVNDANKAITDYLGNLKLLNGEFVSEKEALSAYREDLSKLTEVRGEDGRAVNKQRTDFDTFTKKGRDAQKVIIDTASDLETLTKTRLDAAVKSGQSTDKIVADYGEQRQALIDSAVQLGLSEKAAKAYVDKLLKTPKQVKTSVELTNAEKTEAEIAEITRQRTIYIEFQAKSLSNKQKYDPRINGSSAGLQSAPPPVPSTVLVSPRLYLDGRPIRAALHGDVSAAVATSAAAAAAPRRVR
jgi:hypothetical protein